MILPQVQYLQLDQQLCRWDTALIDSPFARFKYFRSRKALNEYASTWLKVTANKPGILVVSAHGISDRIYTKDGIQRLEDFLAGLSPLKNKAVHFSSCNTLDIPSKRLKRIFDQSGAYVISGYQRSVNAAASATFESRLLTRLKYPIQTPRQILKAYTAVCAAEPELSDLTGFSYVFRE